MKMLLLFALHLSNASPLFELLQHHTTEQLEELFQKSGYADANFGTRSDDPNILTHSCHDLSITSNDRTTSTPPATANAPISTTFLEVETDETGALNDLDCDCQPYSCTCRKQCFCRLSADPFNGLHYPPNANCPQCPSCDDHKEDDDDDDDDHKGVSKPDYKCSCSFDGIGGAGISNGGFMNCDCRVADCSCSKQCACTSKKKTAQGFKEVEESVVLEVDKNDGAMENKVVERDGKTVVGGKNGGGIDIVKLKSKGKRSKLMGQGNDLGR